MTPAASFEDTLSNAIPDARRASAWRGRVTGIARDFETGFDHVAGPHNRNVLRGTTIARAAEESRDDSAVKDKHEDDAPVSVSLETLARHILETPRNDLAALRAAFDRQISSIEARLEASAHQAAIDATGKIIADVIGERVDREQQRAETDLTQALAVNTMLRKALDNAQQQVESAQADLAAAEADRKAMAAQHREALNDKKKLAAELTNSEQQIEELTSERLELQRKLKM